MRIIYFLKVGLLTLIYTLQLSGLFGQAIYTDIIPDQSIISAEDAQLDINEDGQVDIVFSLDVVYEFDTWRYTHKILTPDNVQVAVENDSVAVMTFGDVIDSSLEWSSDQTVGMLVNTLYYGHTGDWYNVDQGFIGIRINEGEQSYYAWLRLHRNDSYSFYLVDYGCNSSVNEGIVAGHSIPQGGSSLFGENTGANYLNGRDIHYSFTKAFDETELYSYRVMIARADDLLADDLNYISELPEDRYIEILIDLEETNYVVQGEFMENSVDINGEAIELLTNYKVLLLNVTNTGLSSDNFFSIPSDSFYLEGALTPVTRTIAYDQGNLNSSSDIHVAFSISDNENFIDEYRIFISDYSSVNEINIDDLLFLGEEYYTRILPDGENVDVELIENQLTTNGDQVSEDVTYSVLVMSIPDSSISHTSVVSEASPAFSLSNPNSFVAGEREGDQIFYYPLTPVVEMDFTTDDSVYFDIDKDNVPDILFRGNYLESPMWGEYYVYLTPLMDNKIQICDHENHTNWTSFLLENQQIEADNNWSDEQTVIVRSYMNAWSGVDIHMGHPMPSYFYLGVSLVSDDVTKYAWLYIYHSNMLEYEILEVAINNSPQFVSDVNSTDLVQLYPNPSSDYVIFKRISSDVEMCVEIYNELGAKVKDTMLSEKFNKIIVKDLPSGVYVCNIMFGENSVETHKLVVY